jgi:hypothetical protein
MKKIFTLLAVFAMTMAAKAQTAELIVSGEGNDIITVSVKNDFNLGAFGFKIDLPAGAELKKNSKGKYVVTKNEDRFEGTVDIKTTETGYSIVCYGEQVYENSGEVFRMQLAAPVTGDATIKGINFTDMGPNLDGTTSVYMENNKDLVLPLHLSADAIKGISADETKSGVIYNMAGQRVSKATKGIYVVDGKKVAVSK